MAFATDNGVYPAFRNAVVGKTSSYNIDTAFYASLSIGLYSSFVDHVVTTPGEGDVFMSTYTTAESPSFANRLALGTVTLGAGGDTVAGAGVVDAADAVFSGASIVGDSGVTDPVESYVIYRLISAAEATSPLVVHFGQATGLSGSLTPNGAAVTVVFNTGGIFKF